MASPIIASAFVEIKPDPVSVRKFPTAIRTQVKAALAKPIDIPVAPKLTAFKQRLTGELKAANLTVPVTPILTQRARAQLEAQLRAQTLTTPVQVLPAAAAGAAPGLGPVAASQEQLRQTGLNAAEAEAVLTTALAQNAAILPKVALETTGLTGARDRAAGSTRRMSEAEAELTPQEALLQRLERSRAESLGLLEAAKQEGLTSSQREIRLTTARSEVERSLNVALREEQAAIAGTEGARATEIAQRRIALETVRGQIIQEQELAASSVESAAARTSAAELASKAELRLAGATQAGALSTTKLAASRAVLREVTSAQKLATRAAEQAALSDDKAQIKLTADLVKRTTAEVRSAKAAVQRAIADERASASATKRARAEALAGRGFVATGLAAVGARGATLAASGQFLAGAAAAVAFFKSVSLAAKLEEELNVFQETTKATADQMERVSEVAQQLGRDITLPAVSANDAAVAMTELAKAGLSVEDSIDAARGTLQLATAAQLDNAEAVNITASALNAFGLQGEQAVHVADLLAGAANEAQGGIGEMGGALSSVASVARQAGISIEDTIALLTLLAKNGIQGQEAGTALRTSIIRLIAPTDKATKILDKFNIRVLDSAGNVRPEVYGDLARALENVSASERNAALATIFGTRAIRAQAVLGREGVKGLDSMRDATNQFGLAANLASARTRGFSGDMEALRNSLASVGTEIGGIVIPVLSVLTTNLADTVSLVGELVQGFEDLENALPGSNLLDQLGTEIVLGNPLPDLIKATRAEFELLKRGDFFGALFDPDPVAKLQRISDEIEAATGKAGSLRLALADASGMQEAVQAVRDLKEQIVGTDDTAQRARQTLEGVERIILALGRKPTVLELQAFLDKGFLPDDLTDIQQRIARSAPMQIKAGFAKDSLVFLESSASREARRASETAAEQFAIFFGNTLPAELRAVVNPDMFNFSAQASAGAEETAKAFALSFDTKLAVAIAQGKGPEAQLAILRAQLAKRQAFFNRINQEIASGKRPSTKANQKLLEQAAQNVTETQRAIESILNDQATAAREQADKIATARNKADQDFLDALGAKRGKIENRILIAEGTSRLSDDIRTHKALRNFLKRSIAEAQKTIKDAKTKAETVQSLTRDLIQENQTIDQLERDLISGLGERFQLRVDIAKSAGNVSALRKLFAERIRQLRRALADAKKGTLLALQLKAEILKTQQEAFDAINESFELDVEFAQTRGDTAAEVRARQRFIQQLQREQKQFRRGTLEWKRLRNEIAAQRAAIREATGEMRQNISAQAQFNFLQTQAGFVANLLGNLIPLGATTGLVGGTTAGAGPAGGTVVSPARAIPMGIRKAEELATGRRPSDILRTEAAAAPSGPTRSAQAFQNHLLQEILHVLRQIYRGTGHPEAHNQRSQNKHALDLDARH